MPKNQTLKRALERSSEGLSTIQVNDYDSIVLVGLGLELSHLNTFRRYSTAVTNATYIDYISETLLYKLVKKIRTISQKKIIILHSPLKAKPAEYTGTEIYTRSLGKMRNLFSMFSNIFVVSQPLNTIVEDRFTAPIYAKSALKLAAGEIDSNYIDDGAHMNVEFGKLWLKSLLEVI